MRGREISRRTQTRPGDLAPSWGEEKSFINYIETQIIVFPDTNVPSVPTTRILWDSFRALLGIEITAFMAP